MKKLTVSALFVLVFLSLFLSIAFADPIPDGFQDRYTTLQEDPLRFLISFLLGLLLSYMIEIPAMIAVIKFIYKNKQIKNSRIVISNILASTLTYLIFWLIIPLFIFSIVRPYEYYMDIESQSLYIDISFYILIVEFFIVLIEALIYTKLLKFKFLQALIISFISNLLSFLVGTHLIGITLRMGSHYFKWFPGQ